MSTHDRVEKVCGPGNARRRTLPGDRKEEFPYGERTFQPSSNSKSRRSEAVRLLASPLCTTRRGFAIGDYPQFLWTVSTWRVGFNGTMRLAAGILLMIAGLIWVLQGLDVAFAPKSFMTGRPWWVLWGAVAIALGGFLIRSARRE
jgi:hypothetical protein